MFSSQDNTQGFLEYLHGKGQAVQDKSQIVKMLKVGWFFFINIVMGITDLGTDISTAISHFL